MPVLIRVRLSIELNDLIYEGIATFLTRVSHVNLRLQELNDLIYEGIATLANFAMLSRFKEQELNDLIYEGIATW